MRNRQPAVADDALLLRAVAYGESDVIATLLCARRGVCSAMARRGRAQSAKGFVLEPFHLLSVQLVPGREELWSLRQAGLRQARVHMMRSTHAMESGGRALRWTRALSAREEPITPVFELANRLLDLLDGQARSQSEGVDAKHAWFAPVALFGFQLLAAMGYGLHFECCGRCSEGRPKGRAAYVVVRDGGVLCERCRCGLPLGVLLAGDVLEALDADLQAETLAATKLDEELAARLADQIDEAVTVHSNGRS